MIYLAAFLGDEGYGTYEVEWGDTPTFRRVSKAPDVHLIPGFVDIHFHGIHGMDFMIASTADLNSMADRLAKEGYEAFLPTTVTASLEAVTAAINNLPDHPMIPGFHLEGPFISEAYPGAQPESAIAEFSPSTSEWDVVFQHPKLKVVTLAPEKPNSLEKVLELSKRGVLVSLGHSNATYEEARRAFEFGASSVTHTFNAMRPFHHREAGLVGYALSNSALKCELIYDRVHVCKEAAELLFKLKGIDGVIAVSDSTAATRLPSGHKLNLWGHDVVVEKSDVRLASNGALAGSTITLLDAFRNLSEDFGPEMAIRACCLNPRRALGMKDMPRVFVELDKQFRVTGLFERG